ncbi:unnamed protein product [Rotaria magnacalcarata]|uniref:Nuclear receptor coactivator 6 TRADD-N domain-containing protein n=1 Tax=Rotaria magnacalcarata TaxID=392030 RepID=A0A815GMQ5_9BILA|nr:unnamed protein product [Rotaria magnacalcarata]CAF1684692.1 unnamed protein product [Rotaria magnacalcarata]CAF2041197.1 unnamed protein product [Rotaria magnacalcarata]CAF2054225.1 unnamed protein product [Rotaria magnacalcarata]CAF2081104.1 unnamed protein product [Rotaria magnacalcarata]
MALQDLVEIRLVCSADYFDPKLKRKLHEIRDKLRQILHIDRRRFVLKKIQPWNSVKVTFDMPKEAVDRLRLLATEDTLHLNELGILSVEIVGQTNVILVNNNSSITNSKTSSSFNSNPMQNFSLDTTSNKEDSKRINIENNVNEQNHLSSI